MVLRGGRSQAIGHFRAGYDWLIEQAKRNREIAASRAWAK